MRKIILSIVIILSFLFQIESSFAASWDRVKVRVTEKIPW